MQLNLDKKEAELVLKLLKGSDNKELYSRCRNIYNRSYPKKIHREYNPFEKSCMSNGGFSKKVDRQI